MSQERNSETYGGISQQVRSIKNLCVDACNNIPTESPLLAPENFDRLTLNYVEGLRKNIEESRTFITDDDNLLRCQFLNDMKEKTAQIEELTAYTRGVVLDVEEEIIRLKEQIQTVQKAKAQPNIQQQDIQSGSLQKAKEDFQNRKSQLHSLIQSVFPNNFEQIRDILGELMQKNLQEPGSGYIKITDDNFEILELLLDMNIISKNPYDNTEVPVASFTTRRHSSLMAAFLVHSCTDDEPFTAAFIFIMTYINITSVRLFLKVQNVFGICKVFACLIVIGGGIYEIAKGNTSNLNTGFEGSSTSAGSIALALYSGLWAYDGWNSVTVVTEEVINPGINVPLSISIAVPLITALYVCMNAAYMAVLTRAEMTSVPAVAVTFGARVLGPASFLVPLGVAVATFGCAMSVQFGITRVCYTAARGGHMLEVFSYVNVKRLTPAPAVAFQALLTSILISIGNIQTLIQFASWFLWFFYGLAMVALLVLRKTHAKAPRPYRVPTLVPCFVLLVAIFLSVVPIVHDPSPKYLIAIGFIIMGIGVYTVFVYYKKTPTALLRKFTFVTQVLFESVPPSKTED